MKTSPTVPVRLTFFPTVSAPEAADAADEAADFRDEVGAALSAELATDLATEVTDEADEPAPLLLPPPQAATAGLTATSPASATARTLRLRVIEDMLSLLGRDESVGDHVITARRPVVTSGSVAAWPQVPSDRSAYPRGMAELPSPYADLERPPLSQRALAAGLARSPEPLRLWHDVRVVRETTSTQAEVAELARAGAREGVVVVAEHQTAGRGRLDRTWTSPPRAGLTLSMLLRPAVPAAALPLLSLLVATAAARGVAEQSELDVRVKWPNDLVVSAGSAADGAADEAADGAARSGDRKVGGLLAEVVGDAVVVGLGLNVSTRADELPHEWATSLQLAATAPVERQRVLLAVLRAVAADYVGWVASGGAAAGVLAAYRRSSATIGRAVRALLPDGSTIEGTATDVDDGGRLLVATPDGGCSISAGDIVHLRLLQA